LFLPWAQEPDAARAAAPFLAEVLQIGAASGVEPGRDALLKFVANHPEPLWLRSLGEGLRRGGTNLQSEDRGHHLAQVFAQACEAATNQTMALDRRLAAIETLAFASQEEARAALTKCVAAGQPVQVQVAALQTLAKQSVKANAGLMISHWAGYAPEARTAALDLLLAKPEPLAALLRSVQDGAIPASAFTASQVQTVLQHNDGRIAELGRTALAPVIPQSRAEVVAKYREALNFSGDASRGQVHYVQRCMSCHRAAGQGFAVGPDLITVKAKGREALLTAILEPNKEVAAQYILYSVTAKTGETLGGIIAEDTATGVTLRMPGGMDRTLRRSEIRGSTSSGTSLMPEGLEAGLSLQEMSDLCLSSLFVVNPTHYNSTNISNRLRIPSFITMSDSKNKTRRFT
jgi:putative heme-binding domain-containing protein